MAGRKKGKGKGKARGAANAAPHRRPQQLTTPTPQTRRGATQATHHPLFSLADEAKWMATHRSHAFDTDQRLRDRTITFVSAGYLEGTIKEHKPPELGPDMNPHPPAPVNAMAKMTIRGSSPTSSAASSPSSSEDEIIFRGRGVPSSAPITTPAVAIASEQQPTISTTVVDTHLPASAPGPESGPGPGPGPDADSDGKSINQQGFEKRIEGESKWMVGTLPWESRSKPGIGWLPVDDRPDMKAFLAGRVDPRDAAMEDYMQNIRESLAEDEPTASSSFARRPMDIGDYEDDMFLPKPTVQSDSWDSDLLHDLDDLSTSSDAVDNIQRIVAVRKRRAGVQYLVVYEGSTTDDTHWLPLSFFKSEQDLNLIQAFEARQNRYQSPPDSSDESSSDERSDSEEDEADGQQGEEMAGDGESDEAFAARLQRELDYGADTGILYDDDIFISHTARSNRTRGEPKSRKKEVIFPSASALADAIEQDPYGGFDIMDTERPSLKPKKKGRRGQMPPEIADPDLNKQLQMSWENDRAKKRLKKAERQEMRKLGLLGRKGKGPDLSVKYRQGADLTEIVEEIRDFLFSDMNTLSLPPMEAQSRAVIHQFVHQFGLGSKSRGDGANRFTVLSKTLRTIKVDDEEFDAIVQRRRFKSRLNGSARSGPKVRPVVSYKDGETVGASAPELGPDNKGRRLLEKMGWTNGTALGALDNKGILQPIAHTVKTTKAGLK